MDLGVIPPIIYVLLIPIFYLILIYLVGKLEGRFNSFIFSRVDDTLKGLVERPFLQLGFILFNAVFIIPQIKNTEFGGYFIFALLILVISALGLRFEKELYLKKYHGIMGTCLVISICFLTFMDAGIIFLNAFIIFLAIIKTLFGY